MNRFGVPYLSSHEVRSSFIQFFTDRGHKFVRSSSVAPGDDPTLLFANSGMNQFKAIFLGDNRDALKRAANSQKCLRVSGKHNDLEEVGLDGTHHTFFEMLGNWSFGDYYKKEAIQWAWQLLTEVWKLPKNRLFVTVYKDDDEASELWKTLTDVPHDRVMKFDKPNFWEMGAVGPCGPCTEIHFDMGDLATQAQTFADPVEGVNGQNTRYVEIWNLVFMQLERMNDGSLQPLKDKHVDTGSGLERVCSVIQGKTSNYETDLFWPIIEQISKITGTPYSPDQQGMCHRVIADHLRAVSFAVADGVTPGNEGRGYVIRRILRRASRFAHRLGQKEPFVFRLFPTLVQIMGEAFPELRERESYITEVIRSEEARFLKTLDHGLSRMEKLILTLKTKGQTQIPGDEAFLFHDTYGFPVDLTQLIAREEGLGVDEQGYQNSMREQKERGRKAQKFAANLAQDEVWSILSEQRDTAFLGYESLHVTGAKVLRFAEEGDFIYVMLDKTPFYAESGGQVGDQGVLSNGHVELRVLDTFKMFEAHLHKCSLVSGLVNPQTLTTLDAQVDKLLRAQTVRNHSATHLLHAALKKILGQHVNQQGSYVGPDRLRFDFTHHAQVTRADLMRIEDLVNEEILGNHPILAEVMSLDSAKASGAQALFGEKYGDQVRVLTMGGFSKELCGGTHARGTGDIGVFRIVGESSIAAGVRRMEALTGSGALEFMRGESELVSGLCDSLKVAPDRLAQRVEDMGAKIKDLERELAQRKATQLKGYVDQLLQSESVQVGDGVKLLIKKLDAGEVPGAELQKFLDLVQAGLRDRIGVFTQVESGQLNILVAVGEPLLSTFKAGGLVSELAKWVDGKGGGRPDKARAGSKLPEKEGWLLAQVPSLFKNAV